MMIWCARKEDVDFKRLETSGLAYIERACSRCKQPVLVGPNSLDVAGDGYELVCNACHDINDWDAMLIIPSKKEPKN